MCRWTFTILDKTWEKRGGSCSYKRFLMISVLSHIMKQSPAVKFHFSYSIKPIDWRVWAERSSTLRRFTKYIWYQTVCEITARLTRTLTGRHKKPLMTICQHVFRQQIHAVGHHQRTETDIYSVDQTRGDKPELFWWLWFRLCPVWMKWVWRWVNEQIKLVWGQSETQTWVKMVDGCIFVFIMKIGVKIFPFFTFMSLCCWLLDSRLSDCHLWATESSQEASC